MLTVKLFVGEVPPPHSNIDYPTENISPRNTVTQQQTSVCKVLCKVQAMLSKSY